MRLVLLFVIATALLAGCVSECDWQEARSIDMYWLDPPEYGNAVVDKSYDELGPQCKVWCAVEGYSDSYLVMDAHATLIDGEKMYMGFCHCSDNDCGTQKVLLD